MAIGWNGERCENLHFAIELSKKEIVRLVLEFNGNRLDGQEMWELQHEVIALHAVMLPKSI